MCILFLAIEQHPDYPLIICANRDEFYQRPTRTAHQWHSGVIAGQDVQAGGTWLGVNPNKKFAALTNFRTGRVDDKPKISRGELVLKALQADSPINANWLKENSYRYAEFNLIYGSMGNLACYNSHLKMQQPLSTGFHAISNGKMDDVWPKMAKGKQALENEIKSSKIENSPQINVDSLFKLLTDQTQAKDEQLPQTGVPYEWEKRLSSIFIQSENYGTRASSIVLYKKDGTIQLFEKSYNNNGQESQNVSFNIEN